MSVGTGYPFLGQLERTWYASRVGGVTTQTPLNQIKRNYWTQRIDNTNNVVTLADAKNNLTIAFWNGLHWIPISATYSAQGNDIFLTAKTNHLSKFGIVIYAPTNIPSKAEPNPFTPTSSNAAFSNTTISFDNESNGPAELKIWDITGTLIRVIGIDAVSAITWDGKDKNGRIVESGVYIYEVTVAGSSKGKGTVIVGR